MKMACLGGHFLVFIREETREHHERNIVFSWNPDLLLDGAKEKLRWDGGGQRLCGEWNPDVLPNGTKNNLGRNEDG